MTSNFKSILVAAAIAGSLSIAGCSTATPMRGPQGQQWVFIECDSIGLQFCYEKANEVCPQGYKLVKEVNESTPQIFADPIYNINITIDCQ